MKIMIKRPNNWNEVQEFTERAKLPVYAYVCRIKKGVVQNNGYGDQLCLLFDINEGEYKDFFQKDFNANTQQDKKWKGVLRLWLPKEDGSEKDEWTKSTLKGMVTSGEKSNPGYVWNWDENTLAGKNIGILFRNEEWEYEGKSGWTARPFRTLSVDSVRNGDFQIPKDKPLKNKTAAADNSFGGFGSYAGTYSNPGTFVDLPDSDGELPF
jgi:hypothetical protein